MELSHLVRSSRASPVTALGDAVLALALAIWGQIDLWIVGGSFTQVPGPKGATAPFLLLFALPLAWRRLYPFGALSWSRERSGGVGDHRAIAGGRRRPVSGPDRPLLGRGPRGPRSGHSRIRVGVAAITIDWIQDPSHEVASLGGVVVASGFFGVFLGGAAWLVGRHVRSRRLHAEQFERRAMDLEREQSELAHAAAEAERVRIARELHDVVAHSVSLMGVQAGAAERVIGRDPDRAREALQSIRSRPGRRSASCVACLASCARRRAVGFLPTTGLASLEPLVARARESGLPVESRIEATPDRSPPASSYPLTGSSKRRSPVHKHAPGAATRWGSLPGRPDRANGRKRLPTAGNGPGGSRPQGNGWSDARARRPLRRLRHGPSRGRPEVRRPGHPADRGGG